MTDDPTLEGLTVSRDQRQWNEMRVPCLKVSSWTGDVAAEWKCSCGGWSMALPSGNMRPQEKAAMVSNAYAEHFRTEHSFRPAAPTRVATDERDSAR